MPTEDRGDHAHKCHLQVAKVPATPRWPTMKGDTREPSSPGPSATKGTRLGEAKVSCIPASKWGVSLTRTTQGHLSCKRTGAHHTPPRAPRLPDPATLAPATKASTLIPLVTPGEPWLVGKPKSFLIADRALRAQGSANTDPLARTTGSGETVNLGRLLSASYL